MTTPDEPTPPSGYQPPPSSMPAAPAYDQRGAGALPYGATGELGKVRGTGVCILLVVVTLGIYSLYWYFKTHEEMKQHSGQGLGGLVALLLAFFIGFVSPFLSSNEVGGLYTRAGRPAPVTGLTGLWYIPGFIIIVGPIVWFVKTNGALNEYWKSLGATA